MKVKVTKRIYDEQGKLVRTETWEEYRDERKDAKA